MAKCNNNLVPGTKFGTKFQNIGYERQILTPSEKCLVQRQNVDHKCNNKLVPTTKFGTKFRNIDYEGQILTPSEKCLFQKRNVNLKYNKLFREQNLKLRSKTLVMKVKF